MRRRLLSGIESLEGKRLLAGDVTVFDNSYGGTLEITGDAADNFIQIEQAPSSFLSGTALLITGLPTADGPTTINGSTNPVKIELYNYDGEIRIINSDLSGGDDLMFFEDVAIPAELYIETGSGNDDVEFTAVQAGGITITGTGTDDVTIDYFNGWGDVSVEVDQLGAIDVIDARLSGNLTLSSINGTSSVSEAIAINNSDISGDVTLALDRASDVDITDGSIGGGVSVQNRRTGDQDINLESNPVSGDVSIATRGGSDSIHLGGRISGDLSVTTSGGTDSVTFDTVDAEVVEVNTGGGNDSFYSENGEWGSLDLRTGNQADDVTIYDAQIEGNVGVRLGGGNDVMFMSGVEVVGNADIWGNNGSDDVTVFSSDCNTLDIRLGRGNDTLTTGQNSVSVTTRSVWNGGSETDTFVEVAASLGNIAVSSFENTGARGSFALAVEEVFDDEEWADNLAFPFGI